jgi:hypothetical protein
MSPPSCNRIAKALESTGEEGDGVTEEVAKVLDRLDAGDVADLCRESLGNGWKPSEDMVDRIKAVLKAALPKFVVNGMQAAGTGSMNSLNARTRSGTTAEGGTEDETPADKDALAR